MRKRIISILLCLCMVLMLAPTTVFAAETPYNIWIGDTRFTSSKKNAAFGNGTATFDPNSSKLTLNNVTIDFSKEKMAAIETTLSKLTIELVGTNTINLTADYMAGIMLRQSCNATITGATGSKLVINSSGKYCRGIERYETYQEESLTIENTTLVVVNKNTEVTGSGYYDEARSTLNIKGNADVTFDGWYEGLTMYGTLNLSGGKLTVQNVNDGIYSRGKLNLTGGTLNATGSRLGIFAGEGSVASFAGTNATLVGGVAGWGYESETATYNVTGGKVVLKGTGEGGYAASKMYSSLATGYEVYAGSGESEAKLISEPMNTIFKLNPYVRIQSKPIYTLTLVNVKEATSASYYAYTSLSYTAKDAPVEKHFSHWEMKVGNRAAVKVGTNPKYTGQMPVGNATLTAVYEDCKLSTATCLERSKCSVCGKEYGILAAHIFTAEVVDAKYEITPPTINNEGVYYKSCTVCGASSEHWNNATFTVPAIEPVQEVSNEAEILSAVKYNVQKLILKNDIKLSSTLNLSDKIITLDLNGHTLKGDINLADNQNTPDTILTLIDSDPAGGGVVDGKITLTRGSGSVSHLYANGGTITGMVSLPSYAGGIFCTSDTPTAFKGYVGNYGEIHGGIFYGGINTDCIKEKTVTFMNGGNCYALEVVANGSKAVAPINPTKNGYSFAGWYNGNTKYDFTQTVTSDITLSAKWTPGDASTEAELRDVINSGITSIKLQGDIKLSTALDLSQKNITLDLNGYVISGADISINTGNGNASLTLKDSRPTAGHTDSTLPSGGVVTSKILMNQSGGSYHDCVLYANGGTVTSDFSPNTNAVAIKCTNNAPTAFTGKISGYAHLYGGIYHGAIESTVKFERKKITFKNGDNIYAYEVLESGCNTIEPVAPPYNAETQTFDGWFNGDNKYTFGSELSEDITLTAKFTEIVTYKAGDANCDGNVNLLDAIYAQRAALELLVLDEQGFANADMNGDGKVTVFDAIAIQKLVLI